jgi:hypothetical protein
LEAVVFSRRDWATRAVEPISKDRMRLMDYPG